MAPALLLSLLIVSSVTAETLPQTTVTAATRGNHSEPPRQTSARLRVLAIDYAHVKVPFEITLWIMLASLAKIGFHLSHRVTSVVPESCVLVILGLLMGGVIYAVDRQAPPMNSDIFFLYLLPPIVLDAGYFLPIRPFFDSLGPILWYAVLGTLWNVFGIGLSLFAACRLRVWGLRGVSLLHSLWFGSLIAAVDPVAVLNVFEEIHINEKLYILVFGESLLNDAVTVVLYKLCEAFSKMSDIQAVDVLVGFGTFLVVGVGGVLIGLVFGMIAALTTRFTEHVRVIEPLFVFLYSYLAYLAAEIFHLSGIMAIIACSVSMKRYVEANISQKSSTTVKYFMKMWSSVSETLIFFFLGLYTVENNHDWDWTFISLTLLCCLFWRATGVLVLTGILNRIWRRGVTLKDQFIIAYGGLRGAICFSLVFLLPDLPQKRLFIAATTVVIFFTVFVQGMTIRPLVELLEVKRRSRGVGTVSEQVNIRLLDHLVAGMEDVCGHWGPLCWKDKFENFNNKVLGKILLRDNRPKSSIVLLYEKLERKHAIELAEAGQLTELSIISARRKCRKAPPLPPAKGMSARQMDDIQRILSRNLYRIRKTTPSYSRHTFSADHGAEQAKEILIRRHQSLRATPHPYQQPIRKQSADSALFPAGSQKRAKLFRSFTAGDAEVLGRSSVREKDGAAQTIEEED